MLVRTGVKGGYYGNHSQAAIVVRTGVKGGSGGYVNHTQALLA
jgi:hypothetical protein